MLLLLRITFLSKESALHLLEHNKEKIKIKGGGHCQGYLNKWLKRVEDVLQRNHVLQPCIVMNKSGTFKTRKAETLLQMQRMSKPLKPLSGRYNSVSWQRTACLYISAGPQIPRGHGKSMISTFVHMDLP